VSMLTEGTLVIPGYVGVDFLTSVDNEVQENSGGFRRLGTEEAGGTKTYCGSVYAATFNYVTPDDLVEFVAGLPWGHARGYLIVDSEFYGEDEPGVQVFGFPGGFPMAAPKPASGEPPVNGQAGPA